MTVPRAFSAISQHPTSTPKKYEQWPTAFNNQRDGDISNPNVTIPPNFFLRVVCSSPTQREKSEPPSESPHTRLSLHQNPSQIVFALWKVTLREVCANKNAKFHVSLLGCWLSFSWPVLENEEAKKLGPTKKNLPSFFRVWICKAKYSINIIMTAHPHTFKQETPMITK